MGRKTDPDHFLGQRARVAFPKWENSVHAGFGKTLFTIRANILEKEIPEDDMLDALGLNLADGSGHARVVDLVRARARNQNLDAREPKRSDLAIEQTATDPVHRDAIVGFRNRREDADDINVSAALRLEQRERAVLSRAPGEIGSRRYFCRPRMRMA